MLLTRRLFHLVCLIAWLFIGGPRLFADCTILPWSGVSQIDDKTFQFVVGATIPNSGNLETCSIPFSVPPRTRAVKLQGTVLFRAECGGDSLGFVGNSGGGPGYALKNKLSDAGGVSTVFVDYTIPLRFTGSAGSVSLQAIVSQACANPGDWEFQGLMEIQ